MMRAVAFSMLLLAGLGADAALPRLDELGGTEQICATLEQMPALCNFHGSVAAGRNVLGIESLTLPPFAQGGEAVRLSVDGAEVLAERSQWLAYGMRREAGRDGIRIVTEVRMVFEDEGVLFRVALTNETGTARQVALSISLPLYVRCFERTWEWATPRPASEPDVFDAAWMDGVLTMTDSQSRAVTAFACGVKPDVVEAGQAPRADWAVSLQPNETRVLTFALAVDGDGEAARGKASQWVRDFAGVFAAAQEQWQARFDAAFSRDNGHFSGWLPTLESDDPALRRLYYGSVLSWLCLERTNFGATGFPRVFVTASPHYAPTLTYFWDTISYATVWSLLDPEQVKAQLRLFLGADIHTCYAIDFLTLKGVGPWYSANDYAVFNQVWTYLRVTGDWGFLDEDAGGKTVLARMEALASHWKTLVKTPGGLADYGTKDNLLETVPTYTNQVASFNAANVWMLRTLARIQALRGDAARAKVLRDEAGELARSVLGLYDKESGWWRCIMPDGRDVEVRSVVDFITVAACMTEDLPEEMRAGMLDGAERELWEGHWLRALSIADPSAVATLASPEKMATMNTGWPGDSLRADHGFTGSYGAWPPLAAEACGLLGRPERTWDWLRAMAPVLDEGPFGQSHYVAGPTRPVRKAFIGGQDYYEGCGGAFAEVILRYVFACIPPLPGEPAATAPQFPGRPKGALHNLRR